MLTFELPYPPSVNHYFRVFRGRTVISRQGRAFRQAVCAILAAAGARPMAGRLCVSADLYPPDRRRRDVDNTLKALLDALEHGGAYVDDAQIVWLLTQKAQVVRGGKVVVRIWGRGTCPQGLDIATDQQSKAASWN